MIETDVVSNIWLCHRIVEYIKSVGVDFDTLDLDEDLDGILAYYGWHELLNSAERKIVFDDLYDMALAHELSEIVISVNIDEFITDVIVVCDEE